GEVVTQAFQFVDGVLYICSVLHRVTAVTVITDRLRENIPCRYGFIERAEDKAPQSLCLDDLATEAILPNVSDHAASAFVEITTKSNCFLQVTHFHRLVVMFRPGL